jgi:plastocyanin
MNPIRRRVRIRGMGVRLLLAVVVVSLLGAVETARADNPVLTGDVGAGDSFTITLNDVAGNKVTHLDAGAYTVTLHDHSAFHNFHLSGPGVDISTSVDGIENKTFTVTFTDGTYFFNCDPHSSQMKGSFTVGTASTPPPPTPTPAPAPAKLAASIGAGSKATLKPLAGLAAGKAVITVKDASASDGFRLSGPGVSKATGAAFRGTVKWTVTLRAGRYSFGSVRSPKLRKAFTISG